MRALFFCVMVTLLAGCVHTPASTPSARCASFEAFSDGALLPMGTVINGYGFTAVPGSLSFYDHARDDHGVRRIGLRTTQPSSGTLLNVSVPAGVTEVRVSYVGGSLNMLPGAMRKQIRVSRVGQPPVIVPLAMAKDRNERQVTVPLGRAPDAQLVFETADEDTVTEICAVP